MKNKRMDLIIDYLKNKNEISTNHFLKKHNNFNASKITLRRDLRVLEEKGYIKLSYGIIKVLDDYTRENFIKNEHKTKQRMQDKLKMANFANSLLIENDVIFVAIGTTCEEFIANITKKINLLITNCFNIATKAKKNEHISKVSFVGGLVNFEKNACFVEIGLESFLNKIFINKLFTGCSGFIKGDGVYFDNIEESNFIRRIFDICESRYLFVDDYKKDKKSLIKTFNDDDFNRNIIFDEV